MPPTATAHPPRPPLVFRVGVVGHRWNRLPRESAPVIQATIGMVLRTVRAAVEGSRGPWYAEDPVAMRLVTSLAEGADRLAAAAAIDEPAPPGTPGIEIHVILPFAETAYRETFAHPAELAEFDRLSAAASRTLVMDGRPGRFDAFVAGGRAVVDHCDLLLAVWDLGPADGAGGTSNQVAYALREEVPVVVVDPAHPDAPWVLDPARPDQGTGTGLSTLASAVRRLLLPPDAPDLREQYFAERHRRGYLGKTFRAVVEANQRGALPVIGWPRSFLRLLRELFRADFPEPYPEAARAEWLRRWSEPVTISAATQARMVEGFAPHFGWADRLATYYANRYRSAFATVFSLSWVTVLLALTSTYLHGPAALSLVLAGIEVTLLLTIWLVVSRGRAGQHHRRWLDYRALAERLRHLTFLWPIGRTGYLARHSRLVWEGDPRHDWGAWLVRAIVREAGMPTGTLDAATLESCRHFLWHHELGAQAAYHTRTAGQLHAVEHRMHPQVELAFAGALLAAVIHLLPLLPWGLVGVGEWHYPAAVMVVLTFAAIVLPAFGAARHGFLGQGDMLGSAMRSVALAHRLRDLQGRLERLGAPAELESLALGDLALEAARMMEADLATWRVVYQAKPLAPA